MNEGKQLTISSLQKKAVKAYTGDKSEEINNDPNHPHAKHLDDLIKSNPNPRERHVLTGVHFDPREKLINGHLHTRGFLSTTGARTPENAHAFANRKTSVPAKSVLFGKGVKLSTRNPKHIMRIRLPKGSRATDISDHSTNPHENETLIHRGSKLKYSHTEKKWDNGREAWVHTHHFELKS